MKAVEAVLLVAVVIAAGMAMPAAAREVKCKVEVDRSVLPAGTRSSAVLKITLEAPDAPPESERTPVNLCIVLDRSGSMGGSKIEYAREAAIEAIRRLQPGDVVSLVTYDSQIETVIPAQHPRNIEWMEEQVRKITPRGMTALFGGVSQGAAELRKHQDGNYVHRMILLSDGIANVGPSQPADLARLGASLQKENIQVSTVGVGMDYNEDLMARLADQAGGNVYFVEHSKDLPRILTAELGEAQQVVARKVVIELTLPEGILPVRIIGRDGRISDNRIEVPMHHLQGGQSRYALVEVKVPSQPADASIELGRARAVYEDIATQKQVSTGEERVAVTFSEQTAAVESSVNRAVKIEYMVNVMALTQEDAIRLNDEGRPGEAAARLRDAAQEYLRVGDQFDDEEMRRRAQEIDAQADVISERGMDNRSRKSFRAESYQIMRQQSTR